MSALSLVSIKHSTHPFNCGWNGGDQMCCIPFCWQNAANFAEANELALSEISGPPNLLKTCCSFIIASPEVV